MDFKERSQLCAGVADYVGLVAVYSIFVMTEVQIA